MGLLWPPPPIFYLYMLAAVRLSLQTYAYKEGESAQSAFSAWRRYSWSFLSPVCSYCGKSSSVGRGGNWFLHVKWERNEWLLLTFACVLSWRFRG